MSENTVTRDDLLAVVNTAGLTVVEQSAYFKCTFDGRKDVRIYIAKSNKAARVDLSGFTVKRDGITQISRDEAKEQRLGAVQGQLDFSVDNETVLDALTKACEALKVAPAKEKTVTARTPKVKVEEPDTAPTSDLETLMNPEPVEDEAVDLTVTKEERRALIKKAAEVAALAVI